MKIKIATVISIFTFLSSAMLSILSPIIVHAVGEQYVFAYPTDKEKIEYLSDVFKEKKTDDPALNGTRVFAKNGVWDSGITLLYDKELSTDRGCIDDPNKPCKQGQPLFTYSNSYNCTIDGKTTPSSLTNGYSIKVRLDMDLGPNFTKNGHDYSVKMEEVIKRENGSSNPVRSSDIPASCRLQDSSGRMGNYNTLSASEKASWNKRTEANSLNDTFSLGANANEDPEADCDKTLNSTLSWILCPVIDMGVNTSNYVFENFIEPFLDNVPISTDPDTGAYKAWQQFRIIANVLLIGTLLAVVYSQIRGDR